MRGTTGKNDNTRPRRDESQLELPSCGSAQSPWRAHPAPLVLLLPCESASEAGTFLQFQSFGMRISSNTSSLCIYGWNNRCISHALNCFLTISSSLTIPWTLLVPRVFGMFSPFSLFVYQVLGLHAPFLSSFIPFPNSPVLLHTPQPLQLPLVLHFCTPCTTQSSSLKLFEEELTVSLYPSVSLLKVLLCSVNPTSVSHMGFQNYKQYWTDTAQRGKWNNKLKKKKLKPLTQSWNLSFFSILSSALPAVNHYKVTILLHSFHIVFYSLALFYMNFSFSSQ